ncbi:hypothetical protein E3W21_04770 [Pseudomonas sp. F01002]|nr:hypothetical protein E3W21_04770 [Pseudomonas sp. F01002]
MYTTTGYSPAFGNRSLVLSAAKLGRLTFRSTYSRVSFYYAGVQKSGQYVSFYNASGAHLGNVPLEITGEPGRVAYLSFSKAGIARLDVHCVNAEGFTFDNFTFGL